MNLHITPSFNIDRLCKTASVLLFLVLNVCCFIVFYVFLCRSVCWFLYRPFCHGALKLDISTLFTIFFLWTYLQFILSNANHTYSFVLERPVLFELQCVDIYVYIYTCTQRWLSGYIAFDPLARGRRFDPRTRHTKDVLNGIRCFLV